MLIWFIYIYYITGDPLTSISILKLVLVQTQELIIHPNGSCFLKELVDGELTDL